MVLGHPMIWWVVLVVLIGLFAFVCFGVGVLWAARHADRIRARHRTVTGAWRGF